MAMDRELVSECSAKGATLPGKEALLTIRAEAQKAQLMSMDKNKLAVIGSDWQGGKGELGCWRSPRGHSLGTELGVAVEASETTAVVAPSSGF